MECIAYIMHMFMLLHSKRIAMETENWEVKGTGPPWVTVKMATTAIAFGAQKRNQIPPFKFLVHAASVTAIDIEYNKRLDRQRPCLEGDFNGGSNNIVQSNKSVWRRW